MCGVFNFWNSAITVFSSGACSFYPVYKQFLSLPAGGSRRRGMALLGLTVSVGSVAPLLALLMESATLFLVPGLQQFLVASPLAWLTGWLGLSELRSHSKMNVELFISVCVGWLSLQSTCCVPGTLFCICQKIQKQWWQGPHSQETRTLGECRRACSSPELSSRQSALLAYPSPEQWLASCVLVTLGVHTGRNSFNNRYCTRYSVSFF